MLNLGGVCSCIGYVVASRRDAPFLFRQAGAVFQQLIPEAEPANQSES